jgi:hypothetical protein
MIVIYWLRRAMEAGFDGLHTLPDWAALTIISAVCGALALWVVGLVLPPARLTEAREQMTAALYELRIYFDSPGHVFAAQGRVIGWSLVYTAWIGLPMLVLGLPFGLMFLQLESRYALAPLPTDQRVVVKVEVTDACDGRTVTIHPTEGVDVETKTLFDDRADTAYQAMRITKAGQHTITITGCDHEITKRLDAQAGPVSSPARVRGAALLWTLTEEPPLPEGPIEGVRVAHPSSEQRWFGITWPWWLPWLILTTVVALLLQKPMKVEL